jgi:putative ABC transport system permease protein
MRAWATQARSFDQVAGVEQMFLSLRANGQQDTVSYAFATSNLLDLLGARPSYGRTFRPEEEKPAENRVAMISHRWWQAAYGGRTDVLGTALEYEGEKYTIIGVMPVGFSIPMTARALDWLSMPSPDVWLPAPIERTSIGFGLLRPGVSADAATRELNDIANTAEVRRATTAGSTAPPPDSIHARAMRAQDFLAPRERRTIEILFVAVGALLLIACANVANLLLVRAWTRRREFAVRLGLGAGRARLVRLALTESVLLALAAGLIGVLIAWQGLRVIIALRPIALDRLADVHLDPTALLWTAGISVATGVLFGSAAAFFVSSQKVADLLKSESRTSSSGGASRRVRSALIIAEIALSVALLVGAGLLTRSFALLQRTPLGFDPGNLVSIDVLIPPAIMRAGQRSVVREAVARQLAEIPGVKAAAFGMLPTAGYQAGDALDVDTPDGIRTVDISQFMTTWIDEDYFGTSGIALVAGRLPRAGASDVPPSSGGPALPPPPGAPAGTSAPGAPPQTFRSLSEEIVVNRALARRIAPNGTALGQRIRRAAPAARTTESGAWSTIVGISDDVRLPGSRGDLQAFQVYTLPLTRMPTETYVVRFTTVPPNVESVLRQAIQRVNPALIARRARVGDDYLREALAPTRFTLALLGAFAAVALVLAVVGLYASIAYAAGQRTREIGIRIALGASAHGVIQLVLADGARLALVGLAIGIGTAAVASRALSGLVYGVTVRDPATFVGTAALVALVALGASYLPARRAARIDPVDALRAD